MMNWSPERAFEIAEQTGAALTNKLKYATLYELHGVKFVIANNRLKVMIFINEDSLSGEHASVIQDDPSYGIFEKKFPAGIKKGLRGSVIRSLDNSQPIYAFELKEEAQLRRLLEWSTEAPYNLEVNRPDNSADEPSDSLGSLWPFDNSSVRTDKRKKVLQDAVVREGQGAFRKELEKLNHGGVCAVTGCCQSSAIQAAHLAPYLGPEDNDPSNGVLLRADIHLLFDRFMIGIEPDKLVLVLHDSLLQDDHYRLLEGTQLQVEHSLSPIALGLRWKWFEEHSSRSTELPLLES